MCRLLHGDRRVREQGPGHREVLIDEGRRFSRSDPGPVGLEPGLRVLADDRALEIRRVDIIYTALYGYCTHNGAGDYAKRAQFSANA